jgi:hypothetical protein
MRRSTAAAAVLAAVVAPAAVTAPAAHAVPAVSTVVVVAGSGVQQTSFATVPGEPYLITATGAFEGFTDAPVTLRTGDCGWWQDTLRGGLRTGSPVTIDGHAAACATLPYSETHTYQWTEPGTGAPFRFATGHVLLAGALSFTVTGARGYVAHTVAGSCAVHPVATPLLDSVPVVVEAGATADEPASAASTSIACDVTSSSGESAHIRLGVPGPAVEAAERLTVPPGDRLTVCWNAGASWDDGVDVTNPTECYETGPV